LLVGGEIETVEMALSDAATGAHMGHYVLQGVHAYGADLLGGTESYYELLEAASEPFQIELDFFSQLRSTVGMREAVVSLAGHERVLGSAADDMLVAYTEATLMAGRDGDDLIVSYAEDTQIKGGGGEDVIDYAGGGRGRVVGGGGADTLIGTGSKVRLLGGKQEDFLQVYAEQGEEVWRSRMSGQADDDTLIGHAAKDQLRGGGGDDLMIGGGGADTLVGGEGGDVFLFVTDFGVRFGAPDRVVLRDFDAGEGDALWLFHGPMQQDGYDPAEARAHFLANARQAGSNLIYEDADTLLILRNTTIDDLDLEAFTHDMSF
jgi:Ca2+-binding RTX toxin-like protein